MKNNLKRPDQRKVYVVDDDDAVRDSLRALLEASGFDVRDYGSAEDFLSHRSTDAKACLLLDLHMPVMSGIELLEYMRSHGPRFPTIMFTGRSDPTLKERALRGGALELMDKPVAEDSLLKAIGRAFASAV